MVRRQLSGNLKHAKKQTLSLLQYNLEQHKGSMEHSLRKGALGLLDSAVIAVAGPAPAGICQDYTNVIMIASTARMSPG
jgi:hypothetical protein